MFHKNLAIAHFETDMRYLRAVIGKPQGPNAGLRVVQIPGNVDEVIAVVPARVYPPNDLTSASVEERRASHVLNGFFKLANKIGTWFCIIYSLS